MQIFIKRTLVREAIAAIAAGKRFTNAKYQVTVSIDRVGVTVMLKGSPPLLDIYPDISAFANAFGIEYVPASPQAARREALALGHSPHPDIALQLTHLQMLAAKQALIVGQTYRLSLSSGAAIVVDGGGTKLIAVDGKTVIAELPPVELPHAAALRAIASHPEATPAIITLAQEALK